MQIGLSHWLLFSNVVGVVLKPHFSICEYERLLRTMRLRLGLIGLFEPASCALVHR